MEQITFREANKTDVDIYFKWANDPLVRLFSYNSELISLDDHVRWFLDKLDDGKCHLYIFQNSSQQNIGQVRIQQTDETNSVIGLSIDEEFRGKGFGTQMLELSANFFLSRIPNSTIHAYVKCENEFSKRIFEKAGYKLIGEVVYQKLRSYHYTKNADR